MVAVAAEGVRVPIAQSRVADVARRVLRSERVGNAMLSITFVTNRRIRRMNREHLGRDRVTDVIAFAFRRPAKSGPVIGDVYIAPDVGRESARANGVPVREEIVRLVVHGTLHALGYDHPEDDRRTRSAMWKRQEGLVRRMMS